MTVNFIELERMAEIATRRGVAMRDWFSTQNHSMTSVTKRVEHSCGTVGCLVGSWLCETPSFMPEVKLSLDLTSEELGNPLRILRKGLGLTVMEFEWLFLHMPISEYSDEEKKKVITGVKFRMLDRTTTEQAVNRLNKFIEYKRIKAQVFKEWNERLHTRGLEPKNPDAANKTLLALAS